MVSNLMGQFQALQQQVSAHDDLLRRFSLLAEENTSLKQEVERLRGLLQASTGQASKILPGHFSPVTGQDHVIPKTTPDRHPKTTNIESRDHNISNSDTAHDFVKSSWATVARKIPSASRPPPSVRKFAAACRAFAPADPAAPKGFEYVYLPRKRKFTRTEIRTNLRRLGVDTSRLLDISFPARSCVGLLVHAQFAAELKSLLAAAKVSPLDKFDPLDPSYLADPKYADLSLPARADKMHELHSARCVGVLGHVRPHLVSAIGAHFVSLGWLDEETLKSVRALVLPPSGRKRSRFLDEDMEDAASAFGADDATEANPTQ